MVLFTAELNFWKKSVKASAETCVILENELDFSMSCIEELEAPQSYLKLLKLQHKIVQ